MNHCGVPGCVVCRGRQCGVPGCVVCDAGARETAVTDAERRVIEVAQQYIAFIRQQQAAPVVPAGLTPTYANLLSRLGAACDALGAAPPSV